MPYEIPTRWPLVQTLANRQGDLFKDARLVNCFAEFNPHTKQYTVEKRPCVLPGTVFSVTPGAPQGIFVFNSNFIQLLGGNLYRNGLLLGAIGSTSGATTDNKFTAAFTSTDANLMMLANQVGAFWISGSTFVNTLNQVTDPNYPSVIVPGVVYINGRFYVMDAAGVIHGSRNLDDPSSWDPLNVIVAQQKSGAGVYLAEQLSYIIALKENSAEVFWDSGQTATSDGTGSTLQPIPGALVPYGCRDPGTVQLFDGTLLWVTSNEFGARQLARLDNLQFQIVSTPDVDRLLGQATHGSINSMVLKLSGHRFYVLQTTPAIQFPISYTMVYDLDQNLWYIWTDALHSQTSSMRQWPFYFSCALSGGQTPSTYVQDIHGQMKQVIEEYSNPSDLGVPVPVDIYTPNYDADVDREKFLPAIYLSSDITKGSKVYVRYSDDDYQTWTNPLYMDLGVKKPMLTDLGSFYRRAFHFHHEAATTFRIKFMGMTMGLGSL